MRFLLGSLSFMLMLTACAPLSKHDSVLGNAGEIIGRTLLCSVTMCLSEVHYYNVWKHPEQEAQYKAWFESLTPEERAREFQRQHERALSP